MQEARRGKLRLGFMASWSDLPAVVGARSGRTQSIFLGVVEIVLHDDRRVVRPEHQIGRRNHALVAPASLPPLSRAKAATETAE
jgi:hypothetical protein